MGFPLITMFNGQNKQFWLLTVEIFQCVCGFSLYYMKLPRALKILCLNQSFFSFIFTLLFLFFFPDNLGLLADRLIGPFDIEAVVDPIGVKISDAIMNFQNSGYEVTGKVFEDCGRPRLQKRQVTYFFPSIS